MGKSSKIVDVLDKEEEELYEVESILGSRLNPETKKTEYQIKWKGYSVKQSTW